VSDLPNRPSQPAPARLRGLLQESTMIVAPFVYDALQAKLAAAAGFRAVYCTGFGTAASFGLPDVGLLGLAEMVFNGAGGRGAGDLRRRHGLRQRGERHACGPFLRAGRDRCAPPRGSGVAEALRVHGW